MNRPRVLFFDIETSPILGYAFKLYETNIAWVVRDVYITAFAWKWSDEKEYHVKALPDYKLYKKDPHNDLELLKDLHALISSADIVCGHNGDKFDVRIANSRFIQQGLEPYEKIDSEDTLKQARGRFKFTSNKLTDLARSAGLGEKIDTGGIKLWVDCSNGNMKAWAKMKKYCQHDVKLLVGVYNWLDKWVDHKYNMNVWNETVWACPHCGSHELHKRGMRLKRSGKYRRYQCKDCRMFSTGTTNLLENKPKIK